MANSEIIARINKALNTIRPHLAVDGGDVEIVEVNDDLEVKLKWLGTCENCQMSFMTMKAGIEQVIRSQVPEVTKIDAINGIRK